MTEIPRPELTQRQSEPLRIFSGARIKEDGSFVSAAHQTLFELWRDEMSRRSLPGILRRIPTTATENETKISLRITPKEDETKTFDEAQTLLEQTRSRFERGVEAWVRNGSHRYSDVATFREKYIKPLETES